MFGEQVPKVDKAAFPDISTREAGRAGRRTPQWGRRLMGWFGWVADCRTYGGGRLVGRLGWFTGLWRSRGSGVEAREGASQGNPCNREQ